MATPKPERETVEQLAEEFVERFRRGERPALTEYTARYPEHAAEIRDLFPALVVMEQVAPDSVDSGLTADHAGGPARAAGHPERLGDYRILRVVGRGGMGGVYEAEQVSLGRHVALKVLPGHARLDPRQLARFQREAKAAARLHHTNIVPVYGVGEADGQHYYVMQFIQGLGLDQVLDELKQLRRPPGGSPLTQAVPPPTRARDLSAVQVARGLLTGTFLAPAPDRGGAEDAAAASRPAASESAIHLPGQSEASTLSDSGRQYWQSVARVGAQVAQALEHARQQGVLHRDIKPSNLLLDEQGNVWVTDFGLAKADDSDDLTGTGDLVGT